MDFFGSTPYKYASSDPCVVHQEGANVLVTTFHWSLCDFLEALPKADRKSKKGAGLMIGKLGSVQNTE